MYTKKRYAANATPENTIHELQKYFLSKNNTKGYAMQAKHAEILQEIPNYPKVYHNFAEGISIFSLITTLLVIKLNKCEIFGKISPIIIIIDDRSKEKQLLSDISRLSEALLATGAIERSLLVKSSKPRTHYYCERRASDIKRLCFSDKQENRDMAATVMRMGTPLEIGKYPRKLREKICVDSCLRSCKHRSDCKYSKHVWSLKKGNSDIQIYNSSYYLKEYQRMSEGKHTSLPVHKYVIFDAGTYPDEGYCQPSETSLRERRINAFLNDCMMQFVGTKHHKEVTRRIARQIRQASNEIFSMPDTVREKKGEALEAAKQTIGLLETRLRRLQEVRKEDFYSHPRLSQELKALLSVIEHFSRNLETVKVEHKPKIGKVMSGLSPQGYAVTAPPHKNLNWLPACQELHIYTVTSSDNDTSE